MVSEVARSLAIGASGVESYKVEKDVAMKPGQSFAIAGYDFKFVSASEINANPRDTKDWPKGVWTLPPSFAEGDKDRAKYAAIGEADNFVLKFQKPR